MIGLKGDKHFACRSRVALPTEPSAFCARSGGMVPIRLRWSFSADGAERVVVIETLVLSEAAQEVLDAVDYGDRCRRSRVQLRTNRLNVIQHLDDQRHRERCARLMQLYRCVEQAEEGH